METESNTNTNKNTNEKLNISDGQVEPSALESQETLQVDTPFSWLMVFAAFFLIFVNFGTITIFGVYMAVYLRTEFANESRSLMSLVGGLGPAIFSLFSPLSGILVAKVGHRVNIFLGGIIFCAGLIIASFATQLWHLFIGQALLVGIALSLCWIPAVSIVPQWFDKYRGLAVGITVAGSGVSGLILAPVIQAIIDSIGWRWALRIHAIVGAVIVISCGFVIRPRIPFQTPKKLFPTDIICDPKFIALWGMGMASCFAYLVPFFIMPLYCSYHGIPPATASLIVGLMNGATAAGRIAMGKLSDRIGNINTLLIANFICALTFVLIWNFATVTWPLIIFALIFGIFSGALFTNTALLTPQLFGMHRMAQVNGPFYTCCAPGYLAGTVTATAIVNAYTTSDYVNYLPCQLFLFGCYMLSCVFLIWLRMQMTRLLITKV